jgi:hypothetical protein
MLFLTETTAGEVKPLLSGGSVHVCPSGHAVITGMAVLASADTIILIPPDGKYVVFRKEAS